LLPPSLQDFIPADDPVHVIAEAVELLDLLIRGFNSG
jgi:hypothetical protein